MEDRGKYEHVLGKQSDQRVFIGPIIHLLNRVFTFHRRNLMSRDFRSEKNDITMSHWLGRPRRGYSLKYVVHSMAVPDFARLSIGQVGINVQLDALLTRLIVANFQKIQGHVSPICLENRLHVASLTATSGSWAQCYQSPAE